jgi:tungstate transport system substrate-binding protein
MRALLLVVLLLAAGCAAPGSAPTLTLGTTTTTQDSGLLDVLLPAFTNDTGIEVRAVVAGSGEIIAKASHGDVDVLLAHSRAAELAFVAAGDGVNRSPVMFNRFLLVGPASDPAGAGRAANVTDALLRIHANGTPFASRADKSGTDVKEKSLWAAAGLNASRFDASWYLQTGAGQSQTLLLADQKDAYALSDEATWAQMRGHGQLGHLAVLEQGDAALKNLYGVTPVNATRHPGVRADLAQRFADWVTGPRGQAAIAAYRVGGQQVFFPDAGDPVG